MTIYEVKLKCKENKKGFLIASVFPTNPEEEMPIELPKKMEKYGHQNIYCLHL